MAAVIHLVSAGKWKWIAALCLSLLYISSSTTAGDDYGDDDDVVTDRRVCFSSYCSRLLLPQPKAWTRRHCVAVLRR